MFELGFNWAPNVFGATAELRFADYRLIGLGLKMFVYCDGDVQR